jgi:hypothetical protein
MWPIVDADSEYLQFATSDTRTAEGQVAKLGAVTTEGFLFVCFVM